MADDNEMLRSLGAAILRRHGYRVLLAEDGREAVEVYEREGGRIDLVVLDLTMPRLSGREALRRLREIDPGVRRAVRQRLQPRPTLRGGRRPHPGFHRQTLPRNGLDPGGAGGAAGGQVGAQDGACRTASAAAAPLAAGAR